MLLNNRYRILHTLGSGGFGETFVAEDTQMPSGRCCVVKKLRPVSNDPRIYQLVKERFQREAAILENLGNQSNKIPKLYAYFEESSDFYLVQELIDGETLAITQQKKGILSESYVKNFLANFLPILDYIHNKQIIHRDIKPDNIIIRQYDDEPVLIDFGAVKESMGTQTTSLGNKTSSIVIGTPGFMPSEQAAGRPVYNSDLYATGLTAVYLLTGKLPQDIETDYHTGQFMWRPYAPEVSPALAHILDKAIQSHVRERYSTAKEMLQALQETMTTYTSKAIQPTVAISFPNNSPTQTVYSTSRLGNLQKILIGGLISAVIVMGFWITKQPQTIKTSTNIPTNPIPDTKSSPSSKPSDSFSSSSLSNSESLPPRQALPSSRPGIVPIPTPDPIPPASVSPSSKTSQPLSTAQISIQPLDKLGLYLASTTLLYSDGDQLKADFRIYCPTSTIRPTNYILVDRVGTVKKQGAWWEPALTPKYDSEYQLIKEVCNNY
jgi:serine/threonine protein kinase, bacterial